MRAETFDTVFSRYHDGGAARRCMVVLSARMEALKDLADSMACKTSQIFIILIRHIDVVNIQS
jgi:hypothetical protein